VTVIVKHSSSDRERTPACRCSSPTSSTPHGRKCASKARRPTPKRYNNLFWGPAQGTGGSTALANSFEQYRAGGRGARAMLVAAAAERWKVPADAIAVKNGVVSPRREEGDVRRARRRGAASCRASPNVKDPKDFVYIGKGAPRTDSTREVDRHGDVHAGREAARHADGGRRASAALRRRA
jgi:isoquinoline 1-oxidoreductase beta subunit